MEHHAPTGLPDDHSEWEPPESMPNSEVKPLSADGSVGLPHVRVGHRQALKYKKGPLAQYARGLFLYLGYGELLSLSRGKAAIPSSGTEV